MRSLRALLSIAWLLTEVHSSPIAVTNDQLRLLVDLTEPARPTLSSTPAQQLHGRFLHITGKAPKSPMLCNAYHLQIFTRTRTTKPIPQPRKKMHVIEGKGRVGAMALKRPIAIHHTLS